MNAIDELGGRRATGGKATGAIRLRAAFLAVCLVASILPWPASQAAGQSAAPDSGAGFVGSCGVGVPPVHPTGGAGFFPDVETAPLQTGDATILPWCVHHAGFTPNLAGYRFTILYDQREIDLIHTAPSFVFGALTPGGSSVPGVSSSFSPLPPSSSPSPATTSRTHTVWVSPTVATLSGTAAFTSSSFTFATFLLNARHTSLTNSDLDFVVSASPILHATTTLSGGLFSVWNATAQSWMLTSQIAPGAFYIDANASAVLPGAFLGLEHFVPIVPSLASGSLALLGGALMLAGAWLLRKQRSAAQR